MPVPSNPQDLINIIREKLFNNTSGLIEEPDLREVLENIVKVLDAKFSMFSPNLTEEQYAQWNLILDYMLRETKGVLTTSSPAPTEKGKYLLASSGTYTNLGGLVATADKLNYAYFDGTTWSKVEVAIQNGKSAYEVAVDNGFVGTEAEWLDSLNPALVSSITTHLFSSTSPTLKSAITTDENDNVYVVEYDGNQFNVYKNNVSIGLKVDYSKIYFTGISCFVKSGIIHMLVASYQPANTENGLHYVTYNIATNTFTDVGLLKTSENAKLLSRQIIDFGGVLYTAVTTLGVIIGGTLDSSVTHTKVHLFRLNGSTWEQVSLISSYGEIIGDIFVNDASQEKMTVADKTIVPNDATLYVKNGELHCIWFSKSYYHSRYLNISKKTTDLINWEQVKAHRFSVGIYPNVIENNGVYFILSQIIEITSPSASTTTMTLKIAIEDDYNYFQTGIVNPAFFGVAKNSKGVYISVNKVISSTSTSEVMFIPWDSLMNSVKPKAKNYRGVIYPNDAKPTDLKAGDYWETKGFGIYNNLEESLDQNFTTFTVNKIQVFAGEQANIVFNGYNFYKEVKTDTMLSARSSYPFLSLAHRNPFMSNSFRIPVILETNTKTLLAFTDVRRTSGADYDEIDVGLRRSYDGGKTWTGNDIIFERVLTDGFRVHDAGAVIDKSNGTIYAFAKMWNANIDPFNSTYWKNNKDKSVFVMKVSTDNGITWGAEQDLTSLRPLDAWHMSSGASTGIQLTDGTLVQPIYFVYDEGLRGNGKSAFIYKSSGSSTWQVGDIVPDFGTDENQIIQLPNGNLLMSCRNAGFPAPEKRRFYELTTIGGGWTYRSDMENLLQQEGGVAESFVRYKNTYIHSRPTNYGSTSRQNVTVFYSYDAINWEKLINVSNPINTAGGGYSSLLVSDNYFGVLHEMPASSGIEYTDLSFYRNILK